MIDEIQLDAEERMSNSVDHTRDELQTIRTGRANPVSYTHLTLPTIYSV